MNILKYKFSLVALLSTVLLFSSCKKDESVALSENSSLTLGNPSNAAKDESSPDNYLLVKTQYALSYNKSRGSANWVSWYLNDDWIGSAPRQNDFRADAALPSSWYHVDDNDYSQSGFDRGHVCPSADRTSTVADNSATFLMTNMIPQSAALNQGVWADFEDYARSLVFSNKELYIISGVQGIGGENSNGNTINTISGGKITVPTYCWKIIVVLTPGTDDAARINENTRVIAVKMPNANSASTNKTWRDYRVSVDNIESSTGYDFLSEVPEVIQSVVEAQIDNQ